MTFYKKLSLYPNPLGGNYMPQLMHEKAMFNTFNREQLYEHLYATDEVEKFLSPILLEQFNQLGYKPVILVNFSEYGEIYDTWLHSDLTYHNDEWKPLGFGINWELQPGETTFNWFEPHESGVPPAKNSGSMSWPRNVINGIRYRDESKLTKIHSVTFEPNTAYLVRTDIPHKISSRSPGKFRECISVRFRYDDIPTWERALEVFAPYFA